MKKRKTIRDQRLNNWPKCYETEEGYQVKGRILTPMRMVLINDFVLKPLKTIWKILVLLLLVDFVLVFFKLYPLLDSIPHFSRSGVITLVTLLLLINIIEVTFRFPIITCLFGKNICLRFSPETLFTKVGIKRDSYDRSQNINFAISHIEGSEHPCYQDSRDFELVISDLTSFKIVEFYDALKASRFVVNCNFINHYSRGKQEFEVDPRQSALAD